MTLDGNVTAVAVIGVIVAAQLYAIYRIEHTARIKKEKP